MKRLSPLRLICAVLAAPAWSQDYSFSVPAVQFEVAIQPDASVVLKYGFFFQNGPGSHAIDVVDIGLPHGNYDFTNMSASSQGVALTDIRRSQYVNPGVEVHLGGQEVPPGGSGTVSFQCTMPDLVYQDTTKKDNASLRITPTWFGSKYVTGTTTLQIAAHLPAGVGAEAVVYQLNQPFAGKALYQGHVVAHWAFANVRLDGPHMVGLSFPKRGMTRVVAMSPWQMLAKWFTESIVLPFTNSESAQIVSGLLFLVVLAVTWVRFAGGTGGCLLLVLLLGSLGVAATLPAVHLLSWPVLILVVVAVERSLRCRKRKYLPPIISVEGGGIKRGLTAPEAAVILELPLNKVLTLVVTGLLKKGLVEQVAENPLRLRVKDRYKAEKQARLDNAQEDGIVTHNYEHAFLDALARESDRPVSEIDVEAPMREFIRGTAQRMKGFNLEQTREYYRSLIAKAWKETEAIGEIPEREKKIDKHLEWLVLEDDFDGRFRRWSRSGYDYYPPWSRPVVVSTYGPSSAPVSVPAGMPSPAPSVGGRTSFGDVATSFVGSAENLMGSTAVHLDPVSLGTGQPAGGVVDLSGFDKVAGDFFTALSQSSGGGGGGGGGCACACAGCACACACAGGGR